ncbi:MAG: thermonuclease family protein [Pseudomonadota bacterium]
MRGLRLLLFILIAMPVSADVKVIDGDTIDLGDVRYRLAGIDAPERGQRCGSEAWLCGKTATERLEALVAGRAVWCDGGTNDGRGRLIATCHADGLDLGRVLVREGLAWAYLRYSEVYRDDEVAARSEARGIWRAPTERAWDYRARKWSSAAHTAPNGCAIKGNISPRGRIYHAPWSPFYDRTRIDLSKGERWFCDEADALAAGWRAPNS